MDGGGWMARRLRGRSIASRLAVVFLLALLLEPELVSPVLSFADGPLDASVGQALQGPGPIQDSGKARGESDGLQRSELAGTVGLLQTGLQTGWLVQKTRQDGSSYLADEFGTEVHFVRDPATGEPVGRTDSTGFHTIQEILGGVSHAGPAPPVSNGYPTVEGFLVQAQTTTVMGVEMTVGTMAVLGVATTAALGLALKLAFPATLTFLGATAQSDAKAVQDLISPEQAQSQDVGVQVNIPSQEIHDQIVEKLKDAPEVKQRYDSAVEIAEEWSLLEKLVDAQLSCTGGKTCTSESGPEVCCPYENGQCCEDATCCPEGFSCGADEGTCTAPEGGGETNTVERAVLSRPPEGLVQPGALDILSPEKKDWALKNLKDGKEVKLVFLQKVKETVAGSPSNSKIENLYSCLQHAGLLLDVWVGGVSYVSGNPSPYWEPYATGVALLLAAKFMAYDRCSTAFMNQVIGLGAQDEMEEIEQDLAGLDKLSKEQESLGYLIKNEMISKKRMNEWSVRNLPELKAKLKEYREKWFDKARTCTEDLRIRECAKMCGEEESSGEASSTGCAQPEVDVFGDACLNLAKQCAAGTCTVGEEDDDTVVEDSTEFVQNVMLWCSDKTEKLEMVQERLTQLVGEVSGLSQPVGREDILQEQGVDSVKLGSLVQDELGEAVRLPGSDTLLNEYPTVSAMATFITDKLESEEREEDGQTNDGDNDSLESDVSVEDNGSVSSSGRRRRRQGTRGGQRRSHPRAKTESDESKGAYAQDKDTVTKVVRQPQRFGAEAELKELCLEDHPVGWEEDFSEGKHFVCRGTQGVLEHFKLHFDENQVSGCSGQGSSFNANYCLEIVSKPLLLDAKWTLSSHRTRKKKSGFQYAMHQLGKLLGKCKSEPNNKKTLCVMNLFFNQGKCNFGKTFHGSKPKMGDPITLPWPVRLGQLEKEEEWQKLEHSPWPGEPPEEWPDTWEGKWLTMAGIPPVTDEVKTRFDEWKEKNKLLITKELQNPWPAGGEVPPDKAQAQKETKIWRDGLKLWRKAITIVHQVQLDREVSKWEDEYATRAQDAWRNVASGYGSGAFIPNNFQVTTTLTWKEITTQWGGQILLHDNRMGVKLSYEQVDNKKNTWKVYRDAALTKWRNEQTYRPVVGDVGFGRTSLDDPGRKGTNVLFHSAIEQLDDRLCSKNTAKREEAQGKLKKLKWCDNHPTDGQFYPNFNIHACTCSPTLTLEALKAQLHELYPDPDPPPVTSGNVTTTPGKKTARTPFENVVATGIQKELHTSSRLKQVTLFGVQYELPEYEPCPPDASPPCETVPQTASSGSRNWWKDRAANYRVTQTYIDKREKTPEKDRKPLPPDEFLLSLEMELYKDEINKERERLSKIETLSKKNPRKYRYPDEGKQQWCECDTTKPNCDGDDYFHTWSIEGDARFGHKPIFCRQEQAAVLVEFRTGAVTNVEKRVAALTQCGYNKDNSCNEAKNAEKEMLKSGQK